ncbi:MAG: glycosyltransferase [Lentimicrobiaceae bacterium]|nr:glycosyltransferase [Lentimicrobiaceae bacterium]
MTIKLYTSVEFWLLFCYLVCFAIQMYYYWVVFRHLAFYKSKEIQRELPLEPVSVIVVAHNEYNNLSRLIPLLLKQDYPDFEIVVVNDSSDDDTESFLLQLSSIDPRIKPIHLRQRLNWFDGKKFPLSIGIKSAQNDLLLLTDADCLPESDYWIRSVVAAYRNEHTSMVLAYGPYEKKKGLLNTLIRFDTLHIAMQYLSMALIGKAYMGVGRNLSYRKSLFYEMGGFLSHYGIPSGDDDLFVSRACCGRKKSCEVLITDKDRMLSAPKKRFSEWVRQKRRHFTTSKFYRSSTKARLLFYGGSQFLFYLFFILTLVFSLDYTSLPFCYSMITILAFFIRMTTQYIIFSGASKRLGEKDLLPFTPLYDLFFSIFTPLLAFSIKIVKPKRWK